MAIAEQQYQQLLADVRELAERVDGIGMRLVGAENIASHHGDEHADLGRDPIKGATVKGHSHALALSVVATNTSTQASGTSHTVALPSGIEDGQLVLVFFAHGTTGSPTVTWPAGWTRFITLTGWQAAYRFVDGTEGASITVTTNTAQVSAHCTILIAGAARTAPEATTATGTSATPNPPSHSPVGGLQTYLWVAAGGANEPIAGPSGYENYLSAGTDTACIAATRIIATATENPGLFTANDSGWVIATISVLAA